MTTQPDQSARDAKALPFDPELLLRTLIPHARNRAYTSRQIIFSQGDLAASLFYIRRGRVRLTIFSNQGRAATIAILGVRDFLGDESLMPGYSQRLASAVAVTDCSLLEIDKQSMLDALDSNPILASFFTMYVLAGKIRAQEDLADHLCHSSEKRLVRLLLSLGAPDKNGAADHLSPVINQEILAEMVGTTRPRINYFMNKFRKMGLIDYRGGLHVSKELENLLQ